MVNEGPAVFRAVMGMNGDTGTLVHQENVFVLVNDVELRRGDGEIGVLLRRRVKEFIVDVELQHVALGQTVIPLRPRIVPLDALQADILLRQRRRQQGNGLGQKTVQPLPGVVFSDFQFLHGGTSCDLCFLANYAAEKSESQGFF